MILVAALTVGLATFLLVEGPAIPRLGARLAPYLAPGMPGPEPAPARSDSSLRGAGLAWSPADLRGHSLVAAGFGALVGVLLAHGDLFLTGPGRSAPGLATVGALAGVLALRMWITSRREARARRLRQELPTVADTLALHVVAGESVATALERFSRDARGVAADEIREALTAYRTGAGLPEVMTTAARDTAHAEAARLYQLLAHAHASGGRLADTLAELAVDYRASLTRELTAEGGRRALATYGPILALMVPTAFVFLMYPTIVGLRQLAGGP